MADTNALVEQLSGLTVLEVADLVKQLEEKWGVSAAAPVAPPPLPPVAAPPPLLSKRRPRSTSSSRKPAANKIGVIKEVRAAVRRTRPRRSEGPRRRRSEGLKEGVTKAEAEEIKKKIEAAGAKVEIK